MHRSVPLAPFFVLASLAALPPSGAAAQERSTHELLRSGAIALEERSFARAAARFREAIAIDPFLAEAHFGAGLAALGDGERRDAVRSLEQSLEIVPALHEARYALGIAHLLFGDRRAAEGELNAVARADRYFLEARYVLGLTAALRDELPTALASLREAIRLSARHAPSHYQLGAVLARTGDLPGAVLELARGIEADPELLGAPPPDQLLYTYRALPSEEPRPGSIDMPIPVLRPIIVWEEERGRERRNGAAIPGWYLYYEMALRLEDAGRWRTVVALLKRALALKDRSESLAIVADRLVDYSPHYHLAKAYHRLGKYRDAYLHLGVAKNEGNATPEAVRALGVLIKKDRLRPRILLEPLPAHTTEEAIHIRGVVIAEEATHRVEISGRDAVLRRASQDEVERFLIDSGQPAPEAIGESVLFDISQFLLGEGTNQITIRPYFRNTARDGDILETRVVRLPEPKSANPAATRTRGSKR